MTKSDLAREAVEKFPNTSKKAIAAYLYKHNPLMFNDQEDARRFVRAITGTSGGKKAGYGRIAPTHKDIYKGLPKGEKNDFSPFVLKPGSYGLISDLHIPYHDLNAIELAIEHFLNNKIKNLILNGDIIDCYQLSRFEKDPRRKRFKYEIDLLKSFLKELVKDFRVIYRAGNHERRYQKFLLNKAPDIFDLEILEWSVLIGTDFVKKEDGFIERVDNGLNNKITLLMGNNVIKAGRLNIIHGDEIQSNSPVNPARGYFNKALTNVLAGHRHQVTEHSGKDLNGKIHGSWSIGCLCDLQPEYMPHNQWQHGFAIVTVEQNGDFEVENKRIIDGKIK